jgi:AcrR family transcriptional regulator
VLDAPTADDGTDGGDGVTWTAEETATAGSRRTVDRFGRRRDQLAEAALQTLSELGYARTSLRDIAQNSEFSHGVLHYYFTDKVDLITHCVRQYKAQCVERNDQVFAVATTAQDLRTRFVAGLVHTLVEDATMHRLWYDLRAQSLFEPSLRPDVEDIDQSLERIVWRVISRLGELTDTSLAFSSAVSYALFDGLFQQSLLRHLSGDPTAADEFRVAINDVLAWLLPG